MKIENQITSPSTSLKLAAQGIRLKSLYGYNKTLRGLSLAFVLVKTSQAIISKHYFHAYTLAELGDMIPWGYLQGSTIQKMPGGVWSMKKKDGRVLHFDSEVEARAHYLIDLLETKTIRPEEVNHPERFRQPIIKPKDILPQ